MRGRLFLVLALATAIGLVFVALRSMEDRPARGRSDREMGADPAAKPAPETSPPGQVPQISRPTILVVVADDRDLPLAGATCTAVPWETSAEADARGEARVPIPKGARTEFVVRASRAGYRPAARRGRLQEDATRTVRLRLLRDPTIRVLDREGGVIENWTWGPPDKDPGDRFLSAPGFLSLSLHDLDAPLRAALIDPARSEPVDVYLLSKKAVGGAGLEFRAPGEERIQARFEFERETWQVPAQATAGLPPDWRAFYAALLGRPRCVPDTTAVVANDLRGLSVESPSGARIFACGEGRLTVTCLARGCAQVVARIAVPSGGSVEEVVRLTASPWKTLDLVLKDRFGRSGGVRVSLLPGEFPLAVLGDLRADRVEIPEAAAGSMLRLDGGPLGRRTLPLDGAAPGKPLEVEFSAVEVHLRLVDAQDPAQSISGIRLRVLDHPESAATWRSGEGYCTIAPVEIGDITLLTDEIGGIAHRIEFRIEDRDVKSGVVVKELAVSGIPSQPPGAEDTE